MKRWWHRRTLKLRLALWYAVATGAVLVAFIAFVYGVIERRLSAENDRQLRIDFDLIEVQLGPDANGRLSWLVRGSHGEDGYARLSTWFEVWSDNGDLLLRHWPVPEAQIRRTLPAPKTQTLQFRTVELEEDLSVRLMERPARIDEQAVVIRIFRDETDMRRALRETLEVCTLGLPLALLLASLGGYFIAHRSLSQVALIAERARRITSESLAERLPVSNPHDELGRLAGVFNETLARLEASFAELKRFTVDASHELRSPLTALRAVGEVALCEARNVDELRESIGSMLEEGQHLSDLIEALLTLARLESGKVEIQREPVAIGELFSEVRNHLGILATEKHQRLLLEPVGDLSVVADRVLLRQALVNIVHNAIRHTPEHSRIELRAARRDGAIALEVVDDGPGVAPEFYARIFERFFRLDKSHARAGDGTGLGLAIARWSVDIQRGRIELESGPGHGSTFRIWLSAS